MNRGSIVAGISSVFNEALVERLRLRAVFDLTSRVADRQQQRPYNTALPASARTPVASLSALPIPPPNQQRGA